MIRSLRSDNFAPFGIFRIDFPPVDNQPEELGEVHLLTGVNGTGKTRILSALAAFLGASAPLTSRLSETTETSIAITEQWSPNYDNFEMNRLALKATRGGIEFLPKADRYSRTPQQPLSVPAFAYSGAAYLTDGKISGMSDLAKPDRKACLMPSRSDSESVHLINAIYRLKLQSSLDEADASSNSSTRSHARTLTNAIEEAISGITSRKFQFHASAYPHPKLEIRWEGVEGSLPFSAAADGLRTIIGWLGHAAVMMDLWLDGKSDPKEVSGIFLLDEIETHLHPAWQRHVLPAFQRLFPKSQIFVATHSPFVIASLNHGWIHPLVVGPSGAVLVDEAVLASSGDSYMTVLEDIMGIKEWYDPETERLLERFRSARDADEDVQARDLAKEISTRGMELHFMMGRELHQMELRKARNK